MKNNTDFHHGQVSPNVSLKSKTWRERRLALFLIIGAVILGLIVSLFFLNTKPKAKKKKISKKTTVVEVMTISKTDANVVIETYGTLLASQQIFLLPQISGRIASLSSKFIPGGLFKKGDIIAVIDDYDHNLIFKQREASFLSAKANLELEEGRQEVARAEWKMIQKISNRKASEKEEALALRKPQLAQAEASVKLADANFKKAKKDLERTKIKIPFDAIIKTKNIDVGSYVSSQSKIAEIIGIENYWIYLTIKVDNLKWIDINNSKVFLKVGNGSKYEGKILKLLPNLENNGLTAQLLVSIKNPLSLNPNLNSNLKSKKTSLLIGSYMKAEIVGEKLKGIFKIPLSILDNRDRVFIFGKDKKLIIKTPEIIWRDLNFAYVSKGFGLKTGDKLITTKIPMPIEGMIISTKKNSIKK